MRNKQVKRMSRRSFDLVKKQREDLMAAYREVCTHCHSQHEAWVKTIKHQAPRYYVTPKQAHEMLSPLIRGDFSKLDKLKPHIRRMYLSMFDELQVMTQQREYIGKSLWFICQFLVTRPAPEFFITESNLRITFNACKKYGKDYHHKDVYGKKLQR